VATLLVYLGLAVNALVSLGLPWIGILATYLVTLLTPQNVWFWAFSGLQPVQYVILPTIVGFVLATLRSKVDFGALKTPITRLLLLLFLTYVVSYLLGPYARLASENRIYDAAVVFDVLWKAFLACALAILLLTKRERVYSGLLVVAAVTVYMTYWINDQYVFGGRFGRIGGPTPPGGGSIYNDENIFAVLFVTGFPIVFYAGRYFWSRQGVAARASALAAFAVVPLMWHAVFLTASRGAVVATGVVLAIAAVRSGQRFVSILLGIAFILAFLYQGGETLHERSSTLKEYEQETSAAERLEAWKVAIDMALKHPLTGVGLGSFTVAFPAFSDSRPRIAHNTPLQIAADSGLIAVGAYCAIAFFALTRLLRLANQLRPEKQQGSYDMRLHFSSEALLLSLVGFFACSMFLSLDRFELFFFLMALTNALLYTSKEKIGALVPADSSTPGRRFGALASRLKP